MHKPILIVLGIALLQFVVGLFGTFYIRWEWQYVDFLVGLRVSSITPQMSIADIEKGIAHRFTTIELGLLVVRIRFCTHGKRISVPPRSMHCHTCNEPFFSCKCN